VAFCSTGDRQVPINDTLAALFREIRKEQPVGTRDVFTFWNGEHKQLGPAPVKERRELAPIPEAIDSVKTSFKAVCRRAEIRNFHFHDLRHTFASQMVMRGASLKDVQEILGHKTMTMTLRYAHLSQEHKQKAVNLLNGLTAAQNPSMSQNVTKPLCSPSEASLSLAI
jgi:integrase